MGIPPSGKRRDRSLQFFQAEIIAPVPSLGHAQFRRDDPADVLRRHHPGIVNETRADVGLKEKIRLVRVSPAPSIGAFRRWRYAEISRSSAREHRPGREICSSAHDRRSRCLYRRAKPAHVRKTTVCSRNAQAAVRRFPPSVVRVHRSNRRANDAIESRCSRVVISKPPSTNSPKRRKDQKMLGGVNQSGRKLAPKQLVIDRRLRAVEFLAKHAVGIARERCCKRRRPRPARWLAATCRYPRPKASNARRRCRYSAVSPGSSGTNHCGKRPRSRSPSGRRGSSMARHFALPMPKFPINPATQMADHPRPIASCRPSSRSRPAAPKSLQTQRVSGPGKPG